MGKVSKVWFAQMAGRIAKNAAMWSSDSLDLLEDYPTMLPDDVFRFTDRVRGQLDLIDERAGRAALARAQETSR